MLIIIGPHDFFVKSNFLGEGCEKWVPSQSALIDVAKRLVLRQLPLLELRYAFSHQIVYQVGLIDTKYTT